MRGLFHNLCQVVLYPCGTIQGPGLGWGLPHLQTEEGFVKLFNVRVEPVWREGSTMYVVQHEGPKEITWRWEIREVESVLTNIEKMGPALMGGYDSDFNGAREEAFKWCDAYAKALNFTYTTGDK